MTVGLWLWLSVLIVTCTISWLTVWRCERERRRLRLVRLEYQRLAAERGWAVWEE